MLWIRFVIISRFIAHNWEIILVAFKDIGSSTYTDIEFCCLPMFTIWVVWITKSPEIEHRSANILTCGWILELFTYITMSDTWESDPEVIFFKKFWSVRCRISCISSLLVVVSGSWTNDYIRTLSLLSQLVFSWFIYSKQPRLLEEYGHRNHVCMNFYGFWRGRS